MADESLNDPTGDLQDMLVSAAYEYISEYGLPDSSEAMVWLSNPDFESVIESWVATAGGFDTEQWLSMIKEVHSVDIYQHGDGIDIYIDFDFEDEDGDYSGRRTAGARM